MLREDLPARHQGRLRRRRLWRLHRGAGEAVDGQIHYKAVKQLHQAGAILSMDRRCGRWKILRGADGAFWHPAQEAWSLSGSHALLYPRFVMSCSACTRNHVREGRSIPARWAARSCQQLWPLHRLPADFDACAADGRRCPAAQWTSRFAIKTGAPAPASIGLKARFGL